MSSLRYFSAGALFTLVILTECFGAHDRSRQRSGPIRSVPVAASVKREVDFDCPEEFGYYPHPTDCTLYYVCVFGGALLESCTGGLMYSHELQTCDWPRNVGCDATGAVVAEDLERLNEREPPPPPQLRRNPPPPPRVQPNPIVTSRGQPKYSRREEYEKQQQLYAEVEDQLPPVEEIETDRQQRVYRGQPSTIGQVQKDRDGYAAQPISSGRTLNANIIPASINQNSKIGSFSFGTQVDERRAPTATPAPQTYSGRTHDNVTETSDRLLDFMTNEIETDEIREKIHSRRKRGIVDSTSDSNSKNNSYIVDRNDNDETMEYIEDDTESILDYNDEQFENERGKRQVRYYTKNGYKTPTKSWPNTKQLKYVDLQQYNYNPNIQSSRYQQVYTNDDLSNAQRASSASSNYFPTGNSYLSYQTDNFQSQRPFKPSLPDIPKQKQSPTNINTQIITKSPPISSLHNNDNPFSSLSGGFYNNNQNNQNKFHNFNQNGQYLYQTVTPKYPSYPDSSQLSSTLVTGKPIQATSTITPGKYHSNYQIANGQQNKFSNINDQNTVNIRPPKANEEYDDEDEESDEDEDESEEGTNDKRTNFGPISSHIPHDYKYPKNKYANIDNPFASPDFNFDDFLSKLRDSHYSVVGITTNKPKLLHTDGFSSTPVQNHRLTFPTSPTYKVISTPKPFTPSTHLGVVHSSTLQPQQFHQSFISQNNQHAKIKPPNFKDDRQLPLTHNFNTPFQNNINESRSTSPKIQAQYLQEVTQKPFFTVTGPNALLSSTRNTNFLNHPSPFVSSENPFVTSTIKPNHPYVVTYKQSTPKPSTTLASQQLAALQHYWNNPSTEYSQFLKSTLRPNYVSDIPNLESLFKQSFRPSPQVITRAPETVRNPVITTTSTTTTTTTVAPPKRKPIPKPSPEMIDYYYDDEDDQYYYEPAVKPKYMPSSEVKPQRPPMAQNYQEYDDLNENKVNAPETTVLSRPPPRRPINYNSYQHDSVTKNHNDVSDITKTPFKQSLKNINGKIPVPVMMDFVTPNGMRPELNDISMIHHVSRNRTVHIRKPMNNDNPYTLRPPKYLNQTTLRPYTVRHRLAKPTSVKDTLSQSDDTRQTRGKIRHHNIVAEMKLTTPSDSLRQETRYTKTSHDDKTNSLEPTESVTPSSYSASPRPKMLYNGSQSYIPDQYDPYYAVYDEDGELYKDTDYEQQYNTASLRPAVQQTYRGTPPPPPPPARRPVETYTPRPVLPDDYDDALIQGQISNQNQYQPSIRQQTRPSSTRGRGSAHYSTSGGSETSQQTPNRGTPPTRSRPTLKPSTAIVSKTSESVDIYTNPPKRPSPVYPQPTPDKTAAKCRKDVCLLPDCFCGGKDIPGELPIESIPQIVLLTFDDSVNDLNKVLYSDLFDKGRVNPNGCPISATFYVSHEWTDYSQVQNLYSAGHEMASHTISHSFGEQFSQKKWNREVGGQREILAAYGGVKLEDVRGMRAPFLSVGGNKMFKMLYDSNFTYDSSLPVYENRPPSWPYTLDYKLFHDCMIPPCPTKSYPGVWEVPMVMWQDLNGGRCSMGDACANPPDAEGVYKMILKNFDRHYTTNRAPFGLFYHAAWFTQPHHKAGFIMFLDFINKMKDVWIVTNWQAIQWVRDPTPISRLNNFQPFQCNYQDRPKKCNNPKVCNLWHKSGVRYMRTCQPCPEIYPWTGKTGIRSSRIDNEIEEK
ncbi:uncharacterized protein LOC119829815 isoform X5 [Zerene cesonia]|uniref:uncharacterized protein LOC119829815 isoform X5 n=1 Tax=Zerene cesonia TaxID=33412 RepID=UPI0018E58643|nr:uncharacterized protein LOC119829815 isoform X5 [Zerene cesonia]